NLDNDNIADDNNNVDIDNNTIHDLPFTSSEIIDVNNIIEIPNATTLNRLAQLKADIIINIITNSKILNQYNYNTYFTSTFPTLFSYNIGKHRDLRRETKQLLLLK